MKKNFALLLLGIILALAVALAFVSKPAQAHPYYSPDLPYPLVIAHQGGDGLWPGNTLYAYRQAAALGVDVLEMDLHITQDGVLVLNHDETVDRTTNGTGNIEAMMLAEIKHWMPAMTGPTSGWAHSRTAAQASPSRRWKRSSRLSRNTA
jgi:glycerophosphoryl diester phosphodiesterase